MKEISMDLSGALRKLEALIDKDNPKPLSTACDHLRIAARIVEAEASSVRQEATAEDVGDADGFAVTE